jgi:hypothetical protein
LTAALLAGTFLAVVFFAEASLAEAFFAVAFLAGDFLPEAFFGKAFVADAVFGVTFLLGCSVVIATPINFAARSPSVRVWLATLLSASFMRRPVELFAIRIFTSLLPKTLQRQQWSAVRTISR